MIKLFAVAALFTATLAAPNVEAQRRPQAECNCIELERRVQGLQNAVRYFRINNFERRQLRQDIQVGRNYLRQASVNRRNAGSICTYGNRAVNRSWVRWQPALAQRGLDIGNRCERWSEEEVLDGSIYE
ncbi:MAG: hypothetical protein AB7F59_12945 [Bdellovibrionales bacterium]